MRVIVTAGGTREPIDSVRFVANRSTGTLGSCIALRARAEGHDVLLLRAEGAVSAPARVDSLSFVTSADLARLLRQHVPGSGSVVHAAAVSDYVPDPVPGKLDSSQPVLHLRLRRTPKLVDGLRGLCPGGYLVGFKLTSGASRAEQLRKATDLLRRARLDLVVANDTDRIGPDGHEALLVDRTGAASRCRDTDSIARELVSRLSLEAPSAS